MKIPDEPVIGIITSVIEEFTVLRNIFSDCFKDDIDGGAKFHIGRIPARGGGTHGIVFSLSPDMGTDVSASIATSLLEQYPSVKYIILVGIAGGIPPHVKIGDVVVSNTYGVIQYDNLKKGTTTIYRNPPRAPSALLFHAAEILQADFLNGKKPWSDYLDKANKHFNCSFKPDIILGAIGSANILLKRPKERDNLYKRFGIVAVEMEGAGVADATWIQEKHYLVIRGINDYCDSNKNDSYKICCAISAFAYTRALIESISKDSITDPRPTQPLLFKGYYFEERAINLRPGFPEEVRKKAIEDLGRTQDPYAIPFLEPYIDENREHNPEIRHWVAWALGKIGGREASQILLKSLKDSDLYVSARIIDSLKEQGNSIADQLATFEKGTSDQMVIQLINEILQSLRSQ